MNQLKSIYNSRCEPSASQPYGGQARVSEGFLQSGLRERFSEVQLNKFVSGDPWLVLDLLNFVPIHAHLD